MHFSCVCVCVCVSRDKLALTKLTRHYERRINVNDAAVFLFSIILCYNVLR